MIPRASAEAQEIVEGLDARLQMFAGPEGLDIAGAWRSLRHEELAIITREIARCEKSLRYYLTNYHVIATEYGASALCSMYDSQELFLGAVEAEYDARELISLLVLKSRQLGNSSITSGVNLHKTIFTPGTNSLVLAYDPETADHLFDMYRFAFDHLPWWMRPERRYESKGRYLVFSRKDSDERMVDPGLNSQITVGSAMKKEGFAGIGRTLRALHCSELWGFPDATPLTKGILPTMHAKDSVRIIESTAFGRGNFFYDFWLDALEGSSGDWKTLFIPPYARRDYSLPIAPGEQFELTEEEVGIARRAREEQGLEARPEFFKWRRKKIEETVSMEGDDISFRQAYPCTWEEAFLFSGTCAFPKARLGEILNEDAMPPEYVGEISLGRDLKTPRLALRKFSKQDGRPDPEPGARLRVWELPEPKARYYISADVGFGNGGDYSCGQVIKLGRPVGLDVQVAEWWGWESPHSFAFILAALGFWYNEAELSPEINDFGSDISNTLFREVTYPQMFVWKHYDKRSNITTSFLGWKTTSNNKGMLVSRGRDALIERSTVIRSRELVDEMFDFQQHTHGSYTTFGGASGNDDRVMSWLIGNFCAHDMEPSFPPESVQARALVPGPGRRRTNTAFAPDFGDRAHAHTSRVELGSNAEKFLAELDLHENAAKRVPQSMWQGPENEFAGAEEDGWGQ